MTNKFFQNAKRGFTLVELLIVIIIIAVLAGIVLIALNPAEQRARATVTALKSNVTAVCRAQAVCLVQSDTGGDGCNTFGELQIADPYPDPSATLASNPDITIDDTGSPWVIAGTYDGTTDFTFTCQNASPTTGTPPVAALNFGRTDCLADNGPTTGAYTCAGFNLQ